MLTGFLTERELKANVGGGHIAGRCVKHVCARAELRQRDVVARDNEKVNFFLKRVGVRPLAVTKVRVCVGSENPVEAGEGMFALEQADDVVSGSGRFLGAMRVEGSIALRGQDVHGGGDTSEGDAAHVEAVLKQRLIRALAGEDMRMHGQHPYLVKFPRELPHNRFVPAASGRWVR
jgi:hypothetical protein